MVCSEDGTFFQNLNYFEISTTCKFSLSNWVIFKCDTCCVMNSLGIPNSISVFRGFASLQVPTVILRYSTEKRLHREQGADQVENKIVQNDQYLT